MRSGRSTCAEPGRRTVANGAGMEPATPGQDQQVQKIVPVLVLVGWAGVTFLGMSFLRGFL